MKMTDEVLSLYGQSITKVLLLHSVKKIEIEMFVYYDMSFRVSGVNTPKRCFRLIDKFWVRTR